MASPSDIPKIQSNFNLNQTIATESSKIDKDRKENPHSQSDSKNEEKDSLELSAQAQEQLENSKNEEQMTNTLLDENDDEPGLNIDIKI